MADCLFCKIISGDIPSEKVYEDELIYAFRDIEPQAPHHIVIVPKAHIESANDINCENSGFVAAICAAPGLVLSQLPLDETVRKNGSMSMTCYEGFEPALEAKGVTVIDQRKGVVVDGNVITASGPGHAVDFGLSILGAIKGETVAQETRKQLML